MSRMCAICGKSTISGRTVSHAHNVNPRTWKPNLQKVRALIDGSVKRVKVCTRCLRSGRVQKAPNRSWQDETTPAT